jgi:hypothetical protein
MHLGIANLLRGSGLAFGASVLRSGPIGADGDPNPSTPHPAVRWTKYPATQRLVRVLASYNSRT